MTILQEVVGQLDQQRKKKALLTTFRLEQTAEDFADWQFAQLIEMGRMNDYTIDVIPSFDRWCVYLKKIGKRRKRMGLFSSNKPAIAADAQAGDKVKIDGKTYKVLDAREENGKTNLRLRGEGNARGETRQQNFDNNRRTR